MSKGNLVFRHGTIFDIFENEKVNADTLLEGMFGQTAGIGSTSISKSNSTNISEKSSNDTYVKNLHTPIKKIVKVVDFDEEKKSKENNLDKKKK